jgi:threonine/homoserine/homoserine lactone efflux protein
MVKIMEQFLSFLVLITLLMVTLFVIKSPILFLTIFFGGATYLLLRGKNKGWAWPHRP